MFLQGRPIQRKLMTIILLTSGIVLAVTCLGFFAIELLTFRHTAYREISTLGEIIAGTTTASLAFENQQDAQEMLDSLRAEHQVVAACLYDKNGALFARYPTNLPAADFPARPGADGYTFGATQLTGFQPVVERNNSRLGTLFLASDLSGIYGRFRLYAGIAGLVIAGSFLLAFLLSRLLQVQISRPILALARIARAVSDDHDYSVRAEKVDTDELGALTEAFNHMLAQIERQNRALSESEAQMRAVLNSALTAVVVIDSAGLVTDWNARAETMFGRSRSEVLGRGVADLILPRRFHDPPHGGFPAAWVDHARRPTPTMLELTALRRDGTEFPVELSVSPVRTGGLVSYCGFFTDITERQQAAARIQAQLGRLQLLSRITRAVGERQDLPSIFAVLIQHLEDNLPIDFGCACRCLPGGETLTVTSLGGSCARLGPGWQLAAGDQLPPDDPALTRSLRGQLVAETGLLRSSSPFARQLGTAGLDAFVAAPLQVESAVFGVLIVARRDPAGFSSGECDFLRQLSEHVALAAHQAQLYEALRRAYDDLRQTQQIVLQQERLRALGQMASGIAHDINNTLSPVALYTESILENEPALTPRTRDHLLTIQRAVEDVSQTVARLREFYRPRESQPTLGPVELNELLTQVISLTRARWSAMPQKIGVVVQLVTEFDPELPIVRGAENEIRDAVTNLILNAVDAMPQGGILTLRTRVQPAPVGGLPGHRSTSEAQLEVTDTGVGMDEDTRRRCLEPFFTTKGERGTGLGLAMVYGMAQRHRARLEILSSPGRGTTVRLSFSAPLAAPSPAPEIRPGHRPRQALRLLLVDDDPLLLRSLEDTLQLDGHFITVADGGQAGIALFLAAIARGEPFAAVITDLGMPHMDGRKVAALVKEVSPQTPVILLTGWGQRLLEENEVPVEVDRVLSKPPRLPEIRAALALCETTPREKDTET